MELVQSFYDNLASHYHKLFQDWREDVRRQARLLDGLLRREGFGPSSALLDCACGIGTQAIGLAALGYRVTASDLSQKALAEAQTRAAAEGVDIAFAQADFRALEQTFDRQFDVILCMDNALPHMLSPQALAQAVESITARLAPGGMLVASIRDYDTLLEQKPPYSPPYIHKTGDGRRVCFQTWDWQGDCYSLTQYIIEDGESLQVSKFDCAYRAIRREELSALLTACGCDVRWLLPAESGFYQPIIVARK